MRARRKAMDRFIDTSTGRRVWSGPTGFDAVSGFRLPIREMVEQRGGRVDARHRGGTRDLPDKANVG